MQKGHSAFFVLLLQLSFPMYIEFHSNNKITFLLFDFF